MNNKVRGGSKSSAGPRTHPAPVGLQAGPWEGEAERLPGIYALLFVLPREMTVTVGRLGRLALFVQLPE